MTICTGSDNDAAHQEVTVICGACVSVGSVMTTSMRSEKQARPTAARGMHTQDAASTIIIKFILYILSRVLYIIHIHRHTSTK